MTFNYLHDFRHPVGFDGVLFQPTNNMNEQQKFNPGDHVVKVSGYRYPGIVVAAFQNLAGQWRYVVECTVPEVAGMLHIYNGGQLEKR